MKKLTTTLTLLALLFAGSAYAAETAISQDQKPRHKMEDGKGKPRFEECDTNKDGALDLNEFLACFRRATPERFAEIDANKDGKVTKEEMRAHREAKRSERRRAFFEECDTNKDGMLSFEEFEKCSPKHEGKFQRNMKRPDKVSQQ